MKIIVFILLTLIGVTIESQAQHTRSFGGKWTYVKIAGDSIKPTGLYFIDSLHGIFSCSRTRSYWAWYDQHTGKNSTKMYWYRTEDGGMTWIPIAFNIPGYIDTLCDDFPFEVSNIIYKKKSGTIYMKNNYPLSSDSCNSVDDSKLNILYSEDFGKTWVSKGFPIDTTVPSSDYRLHSTFSSNTLVLSFSHGNPLCGKILLSSNFANTFTPRSDKVFESITRAYGDTMNSTALIRFDYSDGLHWTVAATPNIRCDTSILGCGFYTLLTSNGGASWSKYHHSVSGSENVPIGGDIQCINNTSSLYFFTHYDPYWLHLTEGAVNRVAGFDGNERYWFSSESGYNTSYLYSSDYGKTWTPEHAYGSRRRGYEAVDVGNVWMTACKEDNIYVPERRAGLIVRTTDNGQTWEEDSTTLIIQDVGIFDGRIVTFSDPRHGWIAANDAKSTYIFKWIADEKSSVEPEVGRELETFRIKIFPNPSVEETNILLPETQSVAKVEVYNTIGGKASVDVTVESNTASISTRTLPTGCYYLKVITGRGATYVRPILVMR